MIRQSLNGVRITTPDNLVLDAGILWRGIDVTALLTSMSDPYVAATAGAVRMGATRDGSTFKSNRTIRQIAVDGLRGPIKGMQRVDNYAPNLNTTLIEHTQNNVAAYFGHVDITPHANYVEIRPRLDIQDTDYINNIALFATVNGSDEPIVCVIENVLSMNAFDLPFKDKNEMAVAIELTGSFDPADITTVPFAVYLPPQLYGSGS